MANAAQPIQVSYRRDDDLELEAVSFFDPTWSDTFEIQRAMHFDEQDTRLGMDTYCLVLSSGQTHYGGIDSVFRLGDRFEIHLTAAAASALGLAATIGMVVDVAQFQQAEPHLRRLLDLPPTV